MVLLEVVISVGILALGMAVIGIQIQNSVHTAGDSNHRLKALMLAESQLAQYDAGALGQEQEMEMEGYFGTEFPGWGWRITAEATSVSDLSLVRLEVLSGDPEDQEFSLDDAVLEQELYTLRASPAVIDLVADFGVDEDQIANLGGSIQDGVDSGSGQQLPPELEALLQGRFDLSLLQQIPTETLLDLMPQLLAMLGLSGFDASGNAGQLLNDFLNGETPDVGGLGGLTGEMGDDLGEMMGDMSGDGQTDGGMGGAIGQPGKPGGRGGDDRGGPGRPGGRGGDGGGKPGADDRGGDGGGGKPGGGGAPGTGASNTGGGQPRVGSPGGKVEPRDSGGGRPRGSGGQGKDDENRK